MSDLRNGIGACLLGLALAFLSTTGAAVAKDVALTEDSVSRFLDSFAEMRLIAMSEGLQAGMDSDAAKNPVAAVIKAIKSSKLKTESQAIAIRHGFVDIKEWSDTGRAIGQAYLYVTAGPSHAIAKAAIDKHKDEALNELEKLGIVNDKQKQKLKDDLNGLSDQLSREPPERNVAIVRQMKSQIEAAVKLGAN
jgi:hypothetical protein